MSMSRGNLVIQVILVLLASPHSALAAECERRAGLRVLQAQNEMTADIERMMNA